MSRRQFVVDEDDDDIADPAPSLVPRSRHPRAAHRRAASSVEGGCANPVPPMEAERHSTSQFERGQSSQRRGSRRKTAANHGSSRGAVYNSDEDIEPPSPDTPSQDGLRLHHARLASDNFIAPWGGTPRGKMERMRSLRHEDPFIYEPDPIV